MFKEYGSQIGVGIFAIVWAAIGIYYIDSSMFKHRTISYDCRLSEISPDFPPEVREQCRKLRATSGRI